jgi:hypothetical protein
MAPDKDGKKVIWQPHPPDFRDTLFLSRFTDKALKTIIKSGRMAAMEKSKISPMAAVGIGLTDQQVLDVIAYIRTLAPKEEHEKGEKERDHD